MTTESTTIGRPTLLLRSALLQMRPHLTLWRWLLPVLLALLVIVYELLISRWLYLYVGYRAHMLADTLLFGSIGPILLFIVLDFIDRWRQERQTSDLQSQMMTRLRNDFDHGRELNDETVQLLFSTHTMIQSLRSDLPEDSLEIVDATETAIDQHIRRVRQHLLETES